MGEKGRVWFMAWSSRRFNWFDLCGGGAERCQKNTFCTRFEIKTGEFGRKPETEILHNCKLWGMIDKCKMHFQGLCKGTPDLKLRYWKKYIWGNVWDMMFNILTTLYCKSAHWWVKGENMEIPLTVQNQVAPEKKLLILVLTKFLNTWLLILIFPWHSRTMFFVQISN